MEIFEVVRMMLCLFNFLLINLIWILFWFIMSIWLLVFVNLGRLLEINNIVFFWFVKFCISEWIWVFVLILILCVGLFRIKIFGLCFSYCVSSTFCWLLLFRVLIGCWVVVVWILWCVIVCVMWWCFLRCGIRLKWMNKFERLMLIVWLILCFSISFCCFCFFGK